MLVTVLLFFQSITLFLFINFEYSVLVRTVFAVLIIQYWTSCRGGGQKTSTNQTIRLLWHRLVISFKMLHGWSDQCFKAKHNSWRFMWGEQVRYLKFWFQIQLFWFQVPILISTFFLSFYLSSFLYFFQLPCHSFSYHFLLVKENRCDSKRRSCLEFFRKTAGFGEISKTSQENLLALKSSYQIAKIFPTFSEQLFWLVWQLHKCFTHMFHTKFS